MTQKQCEVWLTLYVGHKTNRAEGAEVDCCIEQPGVKLRSGEQLTRHDGVKLLADFLAALHHLAKLRGGEGPDSLSGAIQELVGTFQSKT